MTEALQTEALEQEIRTLKALLDSERDPAGRVFAPLADAYRRAGRVPEAVRVLKAGLAKHPDFVTGHVVAAQLYVEQGLSAEGAMAARRALALDGENVSALKSLLRVLNEGGETSEATEIRGLLGALEPDFEKELAMAPEAPVTRARRAREAPAPDGPTMPLEAIVLPSAPSKAAAEADEVEVEFQTPERRKLTDAIDISSIALPTAAVPPSALAPEPDPEGLPTLDLDFDLDLPILTESPLEDAISLDALAPAVEEPVIDLGGLAPEPESLADEAVLDLASPAPDEEVVSLDALAPDEEAVSLDALAPDEDVVSLDALAPDEDVVSLDALAPDEEAVSLDALAPDEDVVSLDALAPDEDVVSLDALAPDEDVVSLDALAPDEEVVSLDALAPDDDVVSLDALAPDEEVVSLDALAPDEETVVDLPLLSPEDDDIADVVDLAALAPDEDVVSLDALAPDEDVVSLDALAPDEDVVSLDALAPDEETVVDLPLLAPDDGETDAEPVVDLPLLAPEPERMAPAARDTERDKASAEASTRGMLGFDEAVFDLDALAPPKGGADGPIDRASSAPDALVDEAVDIGFLSPSRPDEIVIDLDALRPDGAWSATSEASGTEGSAEVEAQSASSADPPEEVPEIEAESPAASKADEPQGVSPVDLAPLHDDHGEPVYTRTLAELYAAQGAVREALEVLGRLRAESPGDTEIAKRIAELESGVGVGEEEVETLARDLAESGARGPDVDSPFSWAEKEADAPAHAPGPTIREYFDGLLGWEPREE